MAFPNVHSIAASSDADTTSWSFSLPATIYSGDLLLLFVSFCNTGTDTTGDNITPSGFTHLENEGGDFDHVELYGKIATGSEGSTVSFTTSTSSPTSGSCIAMAISGVNGGVTEGTDYDSSTIVWGGATADPPSVTATWGSDDNLFIIADGRTGGGPLGTVSTWESNYTDNQTAEYETSTSVETAVIISSRDLASASDNPSTITWSEDWTDKGFMLVVRPGSSGGPSGPKTGSGSTSLAVDASGSGTPTHYGTGSASITLTASGSGKKLGAGSASLTVQGSATGNVTHYASGSTSLTVSTSASGKKTGDADTALTLTASASGTARRYSTGSTSLTVSTSAIGQATHYSTGSISLTMSTSATGTNAKVGQGSTNLILSTTATGSVTHYGQGTISLTLSDSASGTARRYGQGSTSFVFSVSATGSPIRYGSADSDLILSADAVVSGSIMTGIFTVGCEAFLVNEHDLSGDVGALTTVGVSINMQEMTGIDKYAKERAALLSDSLIEYEGFFNPTGAHQIDILPPGSDVMATYLRGIYVGSPAVNLDARKGQYDQSRGSDGSLTVKNVLSSTKARPLVWGNMVTSGLETITSTGDLDVFDQGAGTSAGWLIAHCTSFTGTDIILTLRDSTDNISYVEVAPAAVATFTDVGFTKIDLTGVTTDRYLRVTVSGSFTAADVGAVYVEAV